MVNRCRRNKVESGEISRIAMAIFLSLDAAAIVRYGMKSICPVITKCLLFFGSAFLNIFSQSVYLSSMMLAGWQLIIAI